MALEFDRNCQCRVLGIVEELLGGALSDRGEASQLIDQLVGDRFEVLVRDAFGDDAPFKGLAGQDAPALSALVRCDNRSFAMNRHSAASTAR